MNANASAYIIYLLITLYIIYWVGKLFHRNGRVFILSLYLGNEARTDATNNLLLVAYYLFNIGYAFLSIQNWDYIRSYTEATASLSYRVGLLILILAITHYCNMLLIYILSQKQKSILHHKKQMS